MVARRNTVQKTKILEYLYGVKTHPTAEIVFEAVKKGLPDISLATVYRNLNQMVDEKKISKLEINGEFHFDADVSNHQHFFCRNCNHLIDVYDDKLQKYALKHLNPDFEVENVEVTFKGICKNCKSTLKNKSVFGVNNYLK